MSVVDLFSKDRPKQPTKRKRAWVGTGAAVFIPDRLAVGFSKAGKVGAILPDVHRTIITMFTKGTLSTSLASVENLLARLKLAVRAPGDVITLDRETVEALFRMAVEVRAIKNFEENVE